MLAFVFPLKMLEGQNNKRIMKELRRTPKFFRESEVSTSIRSSSSSKSLFSPF